MALLVPGSAAYLALVLGALRTGVVPVPLDPALTAAERARILADVRPALVLDSGRAVTQLLVDAAPAALAPYPLGRPMHFTSGTTGRPKGVWSGVLDGAAAGALIEEERALWGFGPDDRHLVVSPLHHSAPLRFATGTLLAGGQVLLPGRFDPGAIVDVVRSHQPTSTFCVPAHLHRLLAHLDNTGDWLDTTSFRLVAHAGAPCPETVKRGALALFPTGSVWEFYGATEGQFTVCSSEEWRQRPGTVGTARPGRTISVDADGGLWCAPPAYARFSYWRDPVTTDAAWRQTPDGPAFTVGDLGRVDADGFVFLDSRREDLIISGGVNIYPAEVESTLSRCPGAGEVAVFGVADERWGQRVCAVVTGGASEASLRAWAEQHLAPAKRPKDYRRLPALPRTATGKITRSALPEIAGMKQIVSQ